MVSAMHIYKTLREAHLTFQFSVFTFHFKNNGRSPKTTPNKFLFVVCYRFVERYSAFKA